VYISIPVFFNYDKSKIQKIVCSGFNIQCTIKGKINYSFFPSPRIKFEQLEFRDLNNKQSIFGEVENTSIKISFKNLHDKKKFEYGKINFHNVEANLNLSDFKKYKNFFNSKSTLKTISFKNSKIKFFENKKYIATLSNIKLKYKSRKKKDEAVLKGKFLGDNIYINFKNKKDSDKSKVILLKLSNLKLLSELTILNSKSDKNKLEGDFLFKKDKNRLKAMFDYSNDQINIKKGSLRNNYLDGNFIGQLKLLPYFDFNLDLDLNNLYFTRLYNFIVNLEEKRREKLFKIHNKINGNLNFSTNKIYSKYNLINSLEGRLKFINGNIIINQMLFNLGKLGAADLTGMVSNEKTFTNFKFEKNIFIDNVKHFYSKFGIYNKESISPNIFVSGSFDLKTMNLRFNEISNEKKINNDDMTYIEKQFNEILLFDGYSSLFDYPNLKEFVKLIINEEN
jgi:hypothetical protein